MQRDTLDINSVIPSDSKLISLNPYGGTNGVIYADIDGDKKDEVLYAYTYSQGACIGILKESNGMYNILDLYKGRGVKISYVKVVKKNKKANIVIGWTLDGKLSLLGILRLDDGILQNELKDSQICFNKIDVVPTKNNNAYYIVLWDEGKKGAYKVTIYEVEDGELKKTNKYNKEYYKNVEKYYNILINKTGKTSFYLYNLAMSQYIAEDYKEALKTIDEAIVLKEEEDIPKKKELEKLKSIIKEKN